MARIPREEAEALYQEHVRAVFGYALKVVGNRSLAEDLTADAFVALVRHEEPLDRGLVAGWLKRVVRNAAIDVWRRRQTEEKYAHLVAPPPPLSPEPMNDWLEKCSTLRPVHRTCLMLRVFHDQSIAEVAAATGLSPSQVKGYVQYGIKLLRKTFKESRERGRTGRS